MTGRFDFNCYKRNLTRKTHATFPDVQNLVKNDTYNLYNLHTIYVLHTYKEENYEYLSYSSVLYTVESLSAGAARDPNCNMGTVIILLMRTNLVKLLLVL